MPPFRRVALALLPAPYRGNTFILLGRWCVYLRAGAGIGAPSFRLLCRIVGRHAEGIMQTKGHCVGRGVADCGSLTGRTITLPGTRPRSWMRTWSWRRRRGATRVARTTRAISVAALCILTGSPAHAADSRIAARRAACTLAP